MTDKIDTSTEAVTALMDGVTAGPWRVEHETTLIWGHCDKDDSTYRGMGYPVAECRISPVSSWAHGPDADAGETNARFIAASRELVPALAAERDAAILRAERAEKSLVDLATTMNKTAEAVARLVEVAVDEYSLEPPMQTHEERLGRRSAIRGMMVRLELYKQFNEALTAWEAKHG